MAEHRFRSQAEADLEDIWQYTAKNWSLAQAERYVDALLGEMEGLAEAPRSGRPADHIRPGLLQHPVRAHIVFYRVTDYGIEVVRILHQSMDLPARLRDE